MADNPPSDANQDNAGREVTPPPTVAPSNVVQPNEEAQRPSEEHEVAADPSNHRWVEKPEGPKWTDIAIVILTAGLVLVGYWQYKDMQAAREQTDKLIKAANIQACAADRNADSAETSAQAAADLAAETGQISRDALTQAKATNALASAAKRSADVAETALKIQARPWVGLVRNISNGKTSTEYGQAVVTGHVDFKNFGGAPAFDVDQTIGVTDGWNTVLSSIDNICKGLLIKAKSPASYSDPGKQGIILFPTQEHEADFSAGLGGPASPNAGLVVVGCIVYRDSGDIWHETSICAFVGGEDLTACPYQYAD